MKSFIFNTFMFVLASCRIVLAQELPAVPTVPLPLEQPPNRPGLHIFGDFQQVDLQTRAVFWSNNVVAIDQSTNLAVAPTILKCQTLLVTNDGKFRKMIAEGDVQLDQDYIHARGQRAVYSSETEQLVLTGPFGDSALPMLFTTASTNSSMIPSTNYAREIVYDRRDGKLRTLGQVSTTIPADALAKTNRSGGIFNLPSSREGTNDHRGKTNANPEARRDRLFSKPPGTPRPRNQ